MAYIGTTTPLAATGDAGGRDIYTSRWTLTNTQDYLTGAVFADQAGTFYIEQSGDQINADISTRHDVVASTGQGFSEPIYLPWVRIRFVNTAASPQTALRVYSRFNSAGVKP